MDYLILIKYKYVKNKWLKKYVWIILIRVIKNFDDKSRKVKLKFWRRRRRKQILKKDDNQDEIYILYKWRKETNSKKYL